ncbi:MAG: alpha-galactosidase [Chthonomonadales bacterium]|nr:alpha-galactosidase [Chthonomonadales bacterium]
MPKIVFIGAGSLGFTRGLVRDVLTFPALADSTISLMDIDAERLAFAEAAVGRIIKAGGYPARLEATTDRRKALDGADGVLCTILAAPVSVWRHDIEIPKKYGVDTNVGDTRGPSGVFRALRTIPVMLGICRDMEELCPEAILLNYTNPMAMLCRAIQRQTRIRSSGLCHSVQGTAGMLAHWIGAPMDEVTYLCAGINHQSFYIDFRWKGEDAYPLLREAVERPEIYQQEIVRNEMFKHLGYYVTESSGHNSEYNAWFRKRPDLIERYCTHGTGWNPGVYGYILDEYLRREDNWREDVKAWFERDEPIGLERGHEYAAHILNAVIGDGALYEFNGNVANDHLIENLPPQCCVEVPVLASRRGLSPMHVGKLPPQCAALVSISAQNEEMAVESAITGNPRPAFWSIAYDPLTSAVLSLEEIRSMVREMFAANEGYLPQYQSVSL